AGELAGAANADLQARLDAAFDAQGAIQLSVFGGDRAVLATASSDPRLLSATLPDSASLLQVTDRGRYAAAEQPGDRLVLRVVVPLPNAAPGERRLLQALYPLPARVQPLTTGVEQASFDFRRLDYLRNSLKLTFTLVLTFVLLLSVLFALLAAFGV